MAIGPKARIPKTPYVVYEFLGNDKVYYTGIGQVDANGNACKRATDRWNYVERQLNRLSSNEHFHQQNCVT